MDTLKQLKYVSITFRVLLMIGCVVVICVWWPLQAAQWLATGFLIGNGVMAVVELVVMNRKYKTKYPHKNDERI